MKVQVKNILKGKLPLYYKNFEIHYTPNLHNNSDKKKKLIKNKQNEQFENSFVACNIRTFRCIFSNVSPLNYFFEKKNIQEHSAQVHHRLQHTDTFCVRR